MNQIIMYLTDAAKVSRLNGYTNLSEFCKDLSKKIGRVIICYEGDKHETIFEDGRHIPQPLSYDSPYSPFNEEK